MRDFQKSFHNMYINIEIIIYFSCKWQKTKIEDLMKYLFTYFSNSYKISAHESYIFRWASIMSFRKYITLWRYYFIFLMQMTKTSHNCHL